MANPLPTVGHDSGTWGQILNDFLSTEHDPLTGIHGLASGLVTDVVVNVNPAGAAQTISAPTAAGVSVLTLTAAPCVLTFPTPPVAGQSFTLVLKQNSDGSKTVTWPANILWAGGTEPTLTATASAVDVFGFFAIDATNWIGFVSGQDMK